jgi:hypothetical protein
MHSSYYKRAWAMIAVLAPLPVVAFALALGWNWWEALIPVLIVVALVAELAGIYRGVLAALLATAGISLIEERARHPEHPRNGLELGAMAALLFVAALFGTDRTAR